MDRRFWSKLPFTRIPFSVHIFDPQPYVRPTQLPHHELSHKNASSRNAGGKKTLTTRDVNNNNDNGNMKTCREKRKKETEKEKQK